MPEKFGNWKKGRPHIMLTLDADIFSCFFHGSPFHPVVKAAVRCRRLSTGRRRWWRIGWQRPKVKSLTFASTKSQLVRYSWRPFWTHDLSLSRWRRWPTESLDRQFAYSETVSGWAMCGLISTYAPNFKTELTLVWWPGERKRVGKWRKMS